MKTEFTPEELDAMDQDTAAHHLQEAVYSACALFEELEHRGKVQGNGHHVRQTIAETAVVELKRRWLLK